MSITSDANIGSIVNEKRTMNSVGKDFDQKISILSKSEDQIPSFTFRDTPCEVDETSKYGWAVDCQIKPNIQKNETIDSVFTEIRNGIASWSPIGWEEVESEETYRLKQPEQFTELPTTSAIVVRKTKSYVLLHFYVAEKNSKVKFGSEDPKPNKLGNELLSQIKNLTNIDINATPSFQIFGKDCSVEYVTEQKGNHINCVLRGSKVENQKVFNQLKEAITSILPKNWRYRIEENSFDAERMYGFICSDTTESQKLMCLPITIYFKIDEKGTIYFNIDFDNDSTKLNKS